MNNFTPEYIELCKDNRVQDLISGVHAGDWYCMECALQENGYKIYGNLEDRDWEVDDEIWLPTGDQLDENIIKIMTEKSLQVKDNTFSYNCGVSFHNGMVSQYEAEVRDYKSGLGFLDTNPLIAKIKLLIVLLKDGE